MATRPTSAVGPAVVLRISRWILPVLMVIVVASYVGAAARLAFSLGELFPGVTLGWRKELKMLAVGQTPAHWPGIAAGLETNDRILCIGGYRPNPTSLVYGLGPRYAAIICPSGSKEYTKLFEELATTGQRTVAFDIDRSGTFMTVPTVPIVPFSVQQLFDLLLSPVVLSAGFLFIGFIVFRANPSVEVNIVFAQWVTISAAFLAMDAFSTAIGERLRSTEWAVLSLMVPWIPFWGVSLFHVASLWSASDRVQGLSRRVLPFYYGISVAIAMMGIFSYLVSETPLGRALDWPYLLFVAGSAVVALVWTICLLIWSFVRASGRRDRWQYGVLLGAMLALVPALILPRLALFFTSLAIPAFVNSLGYVALLSVAAMAYAIVRFEVIPVRTRGLEYLGIFAICTLIATVVALVLGNPAAFALAFTVSLLTGIALQLGNRLPFLTRVMRREEFDYTALVAFAQQISIMQPVDELMRALGTILRRYLDVDGLVYFLVDDNKARMVGMTSSGERVVVSVLPAQLIALTNQVKPVTQAQSEARAYDVLSALPTMTGIAVWAPLIDHGELLGVLGLKPRWTGAGYDQRDLELIGALIRQVTLAIANTRQLEQLAGAARQIQEVQERERLKIAREIHDTILQFLLVLTYGLDDIREQHPAVASEIDGWQDRISHQAAELRSLLAYLRAPELLVQHGLVGALDAWLVQVRAMTPIVIASELDAGAESCLTTSGKVAIYRVCREAVLNAIKHAGATQIDLNLRQIDGAAHFSVIDNGHGFDLATAWSAGDKGYSSLQDMRTQIENTGGTLEVESTLGSGTAVQGIIGKLRQD